MGGVVIAVIAIYAFLPSVALSAMPVENGETLLALSKEEGGFADDPILGVVENLELGATRARPRSTWASWPPRSCSSPPTPG